MSDNIDQTQCPECGNVNCLELTVRMKAKPIGEFSLAGAQMKFSAETLPYLYCRTKKCRYEQWGWFDGEHAAFKRG